MHGVQNWKQKTGRKWSAKEISFEAVMKNSQHWSCGDDGWQTVAEAASRHRKCMIGSSGQP